ncbi:myosin-G heavy chain-like isoform X2 [Anopheles bellator]|uniref:myosin-G heavy chain-like isoform X2 n=1 Tax=Anopheles bellator TaxID=139047 RepID=UPI0026495307|nr:myosin-G heavy chain-like isoform X2 [Anopheles bellator]
MAANRRRLALLGLCIFALHILETQGGNPTDSASVSARNANNNSSNNNTSNMNSSGASGGNANTIACQEDELLQCPLNASCDKGRCVCMFRYRLNPAHHGKNATLGGSSTATATSGASTSSSSSSVPYCLPDESNTTGGDNAANPQKEPASPQGGHAGQLPLREPPGAHHILGGVLIPLAFVVIMIGSALLAKRAQLWSRLRQRFQLHRNRHRRRPAYEDVVLVSPPVGHH